MIVEFERKQQEKKKKTKLISNKIKFTTIFDLFLSKGMKKNSSDFSFTLFNYIPYIYIFFNVNTKFFLMIVEFERKQQEKKKKKKKLMSNKVKFTTIFDLFPFEGIKKKLI